MTERYEYASDIQCNWKLFCDASQEYYHVPILHSQEATPAVRSRAREMGFDAPYYKLEGPHRLVSTLGAPRQVWPDEHRYPIETATRSGLMGPWDSPEQVDAPPSVNPGEMQALYDAAFPRLRGALDFCDRFPLDALPEDAHRLLLLVHSTIMVAMCVEVWHQPRVIDAADATLDRLAEPSP